MTAWLADDPEMERRIARMEQRGRRFGVIAIQLAFALGAVAVWTWALTTWPLFDYWVVPSLLPTYGLIALATSIAVWLLLRRLTTVQIATFVVGAFIFLAGIGLGISPLAAGGSTGWCKSVIGNVGLHGDDREECFDGRASRADDVAITLSIGLLVTAVGVGLLIKRDPNRPNWRTTVFPGMVDDSHDQHTAADASETV